MMDLAAPPRPAAWLAALVMTAGTLCLAVITLSNPGATRMFASPWTLAYAGTLAAPVVALILRSLDFGRPLARPSAAWCALALGWLALVVVSAWNSPYQGPSVLWSAPLLSAIALFFLAFDWWHQNPDRTERRQSLWRNLTLVLFLLIGLASMGGWAQQARELGLVTAVAARNSIPLGHANYTAGLGLLMLPLAAAETVQRRGRWRLVAGVTAVLAFAMLFTSGSRGGVIGLATLVIVALWQAKMETTKKLQVVLALALIGGALVGTNPRIRAMLTRSRGDRLRTSDIQRAAMLEAGLQMGRERPAAGWGPGTTPLVYPRFRARLDGGAENVLQLHSSPVQLWAEFGAAGVACLLAGGLLVLRDNRRSPVAAATLIGYGVFSATDWQVDIPIYAHLLAVFAARVAAPAPPPGAETGARWGPQVTALTLALGTVALIVFRGRPDPAPALNVKALAIAKSAAGAAPTLAIGLLRESIALNPDQEIAHFNLGWLLLVRDSAAAERHFLAAARLVPDKGGVYFGLGLARMNQGRRELAARAFAIECLNDPAFLTSGWWRQPVIASLRDDTAAIFAGFLREPDVAAKLAPAVADRLGRPGEGREHVYRRERLGYPVLMRNLDLPPPVDLYDVREVEPAGDDAGPPLPRKGWLPAPRVLALLDAPVSPKP